jgi:hypothetical protein
MNPNKHGQIKVKTNEKGVIKMLLTYYATKDLDLIRPYLEFGKDVQVDCTISAVFFTNWDQRKIYSVFHLINSFEPNGKECHLIYPYVTVPLF